MAQGPSTTDQRTNVADILATDVEAGEVRCNLGYSDTGQGIGAGSPMWFGADGFVSRPNDQDDDGACMAWYIQDGNDKRVLAYRDNRFADKVGQLEPGDRAIVSRGEARFFLKAERDGVTLYTVSKPDDLSMLLDLDGENGKTTISVGGSWIEITNDRITIGVGGGKTVLTIDEDGVQIDGSQFRCATKSGHLGIVAPQVPPVPTVNGILLGPTGIAGVPAPNWTVSPL